MAELSPPVDVYYEQLAGAPPRAVVEVELAGIEPGEVEVDVEGRVVELRGVRHAPADAGRAYQQAGIARGRFRSVVKLGAEADADAARATYRDGVLRVVLPLLTDPR